MALKKKALQVRKQGRAPIAARNQLADLRDMIESTRQSVATAVNIGLTSLYWRMGNRIRHKILQETRAEYGQSIVATLSRQLALDYGNGFAEKSLRRMIQFAEAFPDEQIVILLMPRLSWSHFVDLIPIKDSLKRDFYAEMCRSTTKKPKRRT